MGPRTSLCNAVVASQCSAWGHARPFDELCDPRGQINGLRRGVTDAMRNGGASPLPGAAVVAVRGGAAWNLVDVYRGMG